MTKKQHLKGYILPQALSNVTHLDWYGNYKKDTLMVASYGERIGDLIVVDRKCLCRITNIQGSTRQRSQGIISFEKVKANEIKSLRFMVCYRQNGRLKIANDLTSTQAIKMMKQIENERGSTFYNIIEENEEAKRESHRVYFHKSRRLK